MVVVAAKMLELQLNLRIKKDQNEFVPISIDSNEKLDTVRTKAANLCNLSPCEVLLVFRGTLLQDTDTIGEVGLTAGDCVHCLQAKAQHMEEEAKQLSTLEAHELHSDLSRIMRNRNKKAFFQHVSSLKFSSQALTAVVEARSDPEVLALVKDPVMLQNYCRDTPDALKNACCARPALAGVLAYLITLHRKWSDSPSSPSSAPPSAFCLDALYEADDEFSLRGGADTSSDLEEPPEVGPSAAADRLPPGLPTITPAQLAAALANATGAGSRPFPGGLQPPHRGGALGHPSSTATPTNTPHTSNTPSSASTTASHTPASASASTPHQQPEAGAGGQLPAITSEMLQSALQSVLGAATAGASSPAPANPPSTPYSIPNLEESVRLMAEMGIPDEALSRQALIMTNGDVQSAVEIVFAQLNILE